VSWTFEQKTEECQLKSSIPIAKKTRTKGIVTGVVSDHYTCSELPRELHFSDGGNEQEDLNPLEDMF